MCEFGQNTSAGSASWKKQALWYAIIGGLQLMVDWLVFVVLTAVGCPVVPSNLLARISGALLGFVLNGRITFASGGSRTGSRALSRFVLVWLLLTAASSVAVHLLEAEAGLYWAWVGKPLVDAALAAAGFLAARHWIYAARSPA